MISAIKAAYLAKNINRKITCLIMEEITKSYNDDSDFDNFQLDYEYIRAIVLHDMFRSSAAKASSPVTDPLTSQGDALRMGLN